VKYFLCLIFSVQLIVFSQGNDNCIDATTLCYNQTQFASNQNATVSACNECEDGANMSGNFCYELNNTVWFTFTTNNTGGDVFVNFSNINCDNTNGFNNSIQATVISASVPCDESTYNLVSNCETSNTDFQLSANNLLPNTTYYIQVDGDSISGDLFPASCGFNISVEGEGVEVLIDAGEGSSIFRGESTTLNGTGPANSVWSPASTLSDPISSQTIATPPVTTTYFYTIITADGCTYMDEVTVVVQETLIITNTFTPNDDGINDYWHISSIENFPTAKISVFDRWGQLVFKSVGYGGEKVWTGKQNGITVPSGVYYYIIDLNTESDENLFSGYVTVIK
jgi:gliding motility-associated-like protein